MKLPENVVPMPAEQREKLKRLAEAATPGPHDRYPEDDGNFQECRVEWEVVGPARFYGDNQVADADYYSAVTPDVALATLAYVEALETALKDQGELLSSTQQAHNQFADAFRQRRKEWRAEQMRAADLAQEQAARLSTLEAERDQYRTYARLQDELVEPLQARIAEWEEAFTKQYHELSKAKAANASLKEELAEQEAQQLGLIDALATACAQPLMSGAEITAMVESPQKPGPWTLFQRGAEYGANRLARKALGMKEDEAPAAPLEEAVPAAGPGKCQNEFGPCTEHCGQCKQLI